MKIVYEVEDRVWVKAERPDGFEVANFGRIKRILQTNDRPYEIEVDDGYGVVFANADQLEFESHVNEVSDLNTTISGLRYGYEQIENALKAARGVEQQRQDALDKLGVWLKEKREVFRRNAEGAANTDVKAFAHWMTCLTENIDFRGQLEALGLLPDDENE